MIDGMTVVDGHVHIGELKAERHGFKRFTAEDLVAKMDRLGIDRAVVQHLISPLWEQEEIKKGNNVTVEAVWNFPDRFVGLAVINPKHGRFAEQEARRCLEAGLKGLKIQPAIHGYYPVDGEIMDPIMRVAERAGVPLVTHSDWNAKCCTPYQVARLAQRFPTVPIVMLHMGMDPEMLLHVPDVVGPFKNIYVDTSQTPDLPHAVYVNGARRIGADRLLFGSDAPVVSVECNLTKINVAEEMGLSKEAKRKILGENALKLYKFQ
jgi:predicted TIM-barrel fold metal-dependent hydrolase